MTDDDKRLGGDDIFTQMQKLSRESMKNFMEVFPPVATSMLKWNLEMLRFSVRRAMEYRELAGRLSQCRNAPDFWAEQVRFFENMRNDYAEEANRMLALLRDLGAQSDALADTVGSEAEGPEMAEPPSPPPETEQPATSVPIRPEDTKPLATASLPEDSEQAATAQKTVEPQAPAEASQPATFEAEPTSEEDTQAASPQEGTPAHDLPRSEADWGAEIGGGAPEPVPPVEEPWLHVSEEPAQAARSTEGATAEEPHAAGLARADTVEEETASGAPSAAASGTEPEGAYAPQERNEDRSGRERGENAEKKLPDEEETCGESTAQKRSGQAS